MSAAKPRQHGRFIAGHAYSPATSFQPGSTAGAATRFPRGQSAHNKLPVGSVRVRIETHTRLPRAWVKTSEPNVWRKRAVVVWEAAHGQLPCGYVVHHRDRDSLNDAVENLVGMSRRDHTEEHRLELLAAREAR